MKKTIILVLFIIGGISMNAQNFTGKGDQKLSAGFNFYGHGTGIKATYDYGLSDKFSIGLGGVFYNTGNYESKFFVFGRGDFHFAEAINAPEKLDLYLGAELGLIGDNEFGIGGHLGARFNISNALSLFIEAGDNGAIGVSIDL